MPHKIAMSRRDHPDHHPGAQVPVVAAVAVGGAAGACARVGAERLWPDYQPPDFPWTILLVNTTGCLLMGVLMATVKFGFPNAPRLISPLLGTGVLGGFTSFSHYTDNVRLLFHRGQPGYAVGDLLLTPAAALTAVTVGALGTRALLTRVRATGGGGR
ncbi:CrcB family protein [Streptomyces sp. NBC_00669]|uniref:fluoride efflux transporter FluC n=1 Tax=Streptomyces sp. NBC_00669 TaxID=2976011 RepID=UPI002E300C27|nr:CrcB family protein [Streptomyces sp. NBC_00669]